MKRTCPACGTALTTSDRRRKYCDAKCRLRFHRGARADAADRGSKPEGAGIQSTEAATIVALSAAGKMGTPQGQAALVLARRIDVSHKDTGAGLASMVKRLDELLASLLAGADVEDDPLDELEKRRREKQRAAASG